MQDAIYRTVKQPVAHARLMDVAGLGVGYLERFVYAVAVRPIFQVAMERKNIIHQLVLKLLHIFFLPLASDELPPRSKQIFPRDDILVGMSELNPPRVSPPPTGFACR